MRLGYSRSKNVTAYYVYKSVYKNGKRTTQVVEKLGTDVQIREKYGVDDAEAWAKDYIKKLNADSEAGKQTVSIELSSSRPIPDHEQRFFNGGYLFLQQIYYQLGLDKICRSISNRHDFEYNLNSVLSRLVYSRILYPSSKLSTLELSNRFIQPPDFELHDIYRALSVLAEESDYIQSALYKNSLKVSERHTGVIYYDCTNYFFEIEEESGLRQYGVSKENRPNPIVQMGLFMDTDGIPLAFSINPGNTNEQGTLIPLEKKLIADFDTARFVVCTDAGLSSYDNRRFNDRGQRAFITTQSVKKLKGFLMEWATDPKGWKLQGNEKDVFDLSEIDEESHREDIFYKERWIHENDLEQKLIITYSLKYRDYLRSIRNKQIGRAQTALNTPSSLKKVKQTDPRRFIQENRCTDSGEIASHQIFELDQARICQEERFDGFYAVCTNLDSDPHDIIRINKRRWEIEECFRIMKSDFKARPVYLQRDDRIKAHFMTCFIALILFRYLEKALDDKYTVSEIISALRDINFTKLEGFGYIPSYTKTQLIDDLHRIAGFDTAVQIIPTARMRSICSQTKKVDHSKKR